MPTFTAGGRGGAADALREPGVWPGDSVIERETHGSLVFLAGDRAWKVRKPVHFAFLDQRTLAARRSAGIEELRVNQELAPDTYLALRALVTTPDGWRLAPAGAEPDDAVEYAVEMRRYDERDTLAGRLTGGRVTIDALHDLGAMLAGFHRRAASYHGEREGTSAALARLHRVTEELIDVRAAFGARARIVAIARALEASVLHSADEHDARARRGCWRDGHGDLRADHVVIDDRGIRIVDRLEFDPALRLDDVACDLAFLVMDLEARAAPWAGREVLHSYAEAGGDVPSPAVLAFWTAYRALVSAKVAWLRAEQGAGDQADVAVARLDLAERCAWRTHLPLVLCCCGAPATGKSTLAQELSRRSGLPVLSSDVIRKELAGLAPTATAPSTVYTRERTLALYAELGARADAAVHGGGVIVDATMAGRGSRSAFRAALSETVRAVFVECRAPVAATQQRARRRLAAGSSTSDAGPELAAALRDAFDALDEVSPACHLIVRSDLALEALADAVQAGLDTSRGLLRTRTTDGPRQLSRQSPMAAG